jgi:hypothetical protein
VLDALAARDALDDTLFVITSDHGMAQQDLSVSGDWARELIASGIVSGVACERFLYLHDLALTVERADDALQVTVRALDADETGVQPAVAATARVLVNGEERARAAADAHGRIALGDVPSDATIVIAAEGFNERLLRADGVEIVPAAQALLYGATAADRAT